MLLFSILCRFILYLLGWDFPDRDLLQHEEKKLIILYPHTSKWDAVIGALFRVGYFYHRNVRLLMWDEYYERWGPKFMDKLGFIPVNNEKTKGNTSRIADQLNKFDEFIFAISPEGTLQKNKRLKSGFYHLAKKTNAKITVLNLDFYKQKI